MTLDRTLLVIASISLLVSPALAADWSQYFENKGRVTFYIDKQSLVTLKNGHKQLWEKQLFSKVDQAFGTGLLYLFEVDCADRRFEQKAMRPLEQTIEHLKNVASIEQYYAGWQTFEPNDLHEQRFKTWCGVK